MLTPVKVYALAPDYSSIVSQDSRVALDDDSFAAQAAGKRGNTSLQGALLHQKSLEQGLLAVFEQPLEFAVHDSTPNIFGFSFGPRRHIEKRSWIDPRRIFGNAVSSETEVFVNHVSIRREQIKVIGRYQLKVTITKDGLGDLLKAKVTTATDRLVTPTGNEPIVGNVNLADSESPEPKFVVTPPGGVAGQDVKLTAENAQVDLRQDQSVLVGGEPASLIADQKKKESVVFRIPKPTNETVEHPVSIDLVFANGQSTIYVPSAFTYNSKK